MRNISFSNSISKLIYNIEELELPYASTYKLLKDTKSMKLQEKMIAQVTDLPYEKKLFDIFKIESRTIKTKAEKSDYDSDRTSYELHYWIRIINPRFKCRRYIYPGDYIVNLIFNPFSGWNMTFYQDSCDMHGEHSFALAEHPHIQNGRGCFGGHKVAIDNSLWSANFYGACKLIRKYLEEYNGRDTYTRGKWFDIKENLLNLDVNQYGYCKTNLDDKLKAEWDTFKTVHFDSYRLKHKFRKVMEGRYTSSCMRTPLDIFNTFKFFNKVGRFEDGREGLPIEMTLNILSMFNTVNPISIATGNGTRYNPLWTQFDEYEEVKSKLTDCFPEYTDIYKEASYMINRNGSYYLKMHYRLTDALLKPLRASYYGLDKIMYGSNNGPELCAPKWFTQNIDVFLKKEDELMEQGSDFSFDLTGDINKSVSSDGNLYQETVLKIKELKVELEQLQYLVTKEKLNYLERERRKLLNEINNNTAKPETHQLSLGAL